MSSGLDGLITAALNEGKPPDVNRSSEILVPEILFFALATIAVFARLYVRLRLKPKLWWDDWTMFIAYVSLHASSHHKTLTMAAIGLGLLRARHYADASTLRAWTT